jgi:EmrB/QacA subfamily drug resistance transporter
MQANTSPWGALPVLLAGAFMVVLDFFIVNVALPSIGTDLRAGESALEWIVAGYGLAFAAFLVTAGRLGDMFGRRRMYVIGLILFTAASAACGIAPSPTTLVVARIAQGAAGAIVTPQVLAIVGVAFRGPDYVRALSIYGSVLGLAAVGGQIIGGVLVDSAVGWRGCFLINIPVGLAALAFTHRVPESRGEQRAPLDLTGATMLAIGLTAVLLPLIEGRQLGWPAWTWVCLAAAPAIIAVFLRRQAQIEHPLLDLTLFRRRGFSAGLVTQFCLACTQASFFVYLALYLQVERGLSALDAGLMFAIVAVAYVAMSAPAPALTERFGRTVIAAGGVSLTLGLALLAAVADGTLASLAPGLLLVGAGIGLCFTPLTSIVLADVEADRAGSASGALSTTQQVGFALGVAITGVVYFGAAADEAFTLSLIQLTAVAACIVVASRMLRRLPS